MRVSWLHAGVTPADNKSTAFGLGWGPSESRGQGWAFDVSQCFNASIKNAFAS